VGEALGTQESCSCADCRAGCTRKPGWFKPGEAEKTAEMMGLPMQDFFDRYLAVDWWEDDPNVYVLSPAIVGEEAGTMFPGAPWGTCVFYKDGLCEIHEAKPFEWADMLHGRFATESHEEVARTGEGHEEQITELLGEEPQANGFSSFDLMMGMRKF
jgi:hypothetical protein